MGTLWHRTGHRGAFLLFLALLDAAVGYSLLTAPPGETAVLHLALPPAWWAVAWIAVAAACATGAFTRRDRAAYALAAALKGTWAGITGWAWLRYHIPQGWLGMAFWAAFAVTVLLVSSWPEPPPPPRTPSPPVIRAPR